MKIYHICRIMHGRSDATKELHSSVTVEEMEEDLAAAAEDAGELPKFLQVDRPP
jgi:hypothetical protein